MKTPRYEQTLTNARARLAWVQHLHDANSVPHSDCWVCWLVRAIERDIATLTEHAINHGYTCGVNIYRSLDRCPRVVPLVDEYASNEPIQTQCAHCPGCPPPHHDWCKDRRPHGEHPMENGRTCCGSTD